MIECGFSEQKFWNLSPRKLLMIMKEKKRKDLEHMKVLAYLIQGGTLEEDEEEEEEGGLIGVDRPASAGMTSWLGSGGIVYGK